MVCFAIHHYEVCSSFAHLERLNFSYCPMETERYRRPDKIISYRERRLPLFPVIFLSADFEEVHSTTITAIPYVQRFISFGGEPLPVPEDVMAELCADNRIQQLRQIF
ncbi:transcription termination/antitermination NusG family protein [Escherichia coli]|uniref:transcription termination/antitermination NusG family protein n=1 Tax=Escherichia coli TaxID=562 RepID=UPI002022C0CC|nr:transcription termination/antitermination NusG family protein [Escherichia coli]